MATNKEIADAFRAALPRLWDGLEDCPTNQSYLVCTALMFAGHREWMSARDLVMERIHPHSYYSAFVEDRDKKYYPMEELQALRRQFVLDLIEELDPQPVEEKTHEKP